jgi:minor extracellular serine protease Vpr
MGSRLIHVMFRFVVPACLVLTLYAYGPQASAPQSEPTSGREPATMRSLLRYALPGTRDLQLVIELNEPSVARSLASTRGGAVPAGAGRRARVRMDSAEAATYRAQLARTQSAMSERLSALSGVEVQGATDAVMNVIIARVPIEHYRTVRGMEGIKRVYISRLQRKNLSAAAEVHNAPALWGQVPGGRANAGQGVMIGVIDTGIDNTHPMFTDSTAALPSGFPKFSSGNSAYTNHKVIVARDYTRFFANAETSSHRNARDYEGHGTFVAGCAAGKIVTPNTALLPSPAQISGMAPGAFLGSYKVFGTPGVNDYATSAAIIAAINDAVNDGMDVVNLSLGALDYVPPSEDPEVVAIDNAVAAGVVVCIAAGNEGPDMHTIGTPGSSADAISLSWISELQRGEVQDYESRIRGKSSGKSENEECHNSNRVRHQTGL